MSQKRFIRVLVETMAAVMFLGAATLTLFVPDWLEKIFDVHPDPGGGEVEWLIAGGLFLVAAVLCLDVTSALTPSRRSRSRPLPETSRIGDRNG